MANTRNRKDARVPADGGTGGQTLAHCWASVDSESPNSTMSGDQKRPNDGRQASNPRATTPERHSPRRPVAGPQRAVLHLGALDSTYNWNKVTAC